MYAFSNQRRKPPLEKALALRSRSCSSAAKHGVGAGFQFALWVIDQGFNDECTFALVDRGRDPPDFASNFRSPKASIDTSATCPVLIHGAIRSGTSNRSRIGSIFTRVNRGVFARTYWPVVTVPLSSLPRKARKR